MSTTTATFGHEIASDAAKAPRQPRWLTWLINARERQARARVRSTFRMMSDAQLKDIGLSPDQVRHVRSHNDLPIDFWRI